MKWRDGVFVICPFCSAPRISGDSRDGGKMIQLYNDKKLKQADCARTRRHTYKCDCEIVEAWLDAPKHTRADERSAMFIVKQCAMANMVLSKALSYVVTRHDLSTLCTFDQAELIAGKAANITALAIYRNVRNSSLIQDNYRLPPIPLLESHARILAEELSKR